MDTHKTRMQELMGRIERQRRKCERAARRTAKLERRIAYIGFPATR